MKTSARRLEKTVVGWHCGCSEKGLVEMVRQAEDTKGYLTLSLTPVNEVAYARLLSTTNWWYVLRPNFGSANWLSKYLSRKVKSASTRCQSWISVVVNVDRPESRRVRTVVYAREPVVQVAAGMGWPQLAGGDVGEGSTGQLSAAADLTVFLDVSRHFIWTDPKQTKITTTTAGLPVSGAYHVTISAPLVRATSFLRSRLQQRKSRNRIPYGKWRSVALA